MVKEESRKRMSEARKKLYANGWINPMQGKHHTPESREKMSKSQKKLYVDGYVNPMQGRHHSEESIEKMSESTKKLYTGGWVHPLQGKHHAEETKRKISKANKGQHHSPTTEFKKGHTLNKGNERSIEHRKNLSKARTGKPMLSIRGENHCNWKGGITAINTTIRTSLKGRNWRRQVFMRDNYTCQGCGDSTGGNLNAHHILPFSEFPEYVFEEENGVTLCEPCHKGVHLFIN